MQLSFQFYAYQLEFRDHYRSHKSLHHPKLLQKYLLRVLQVLRQLSCQQFHKLNDVNRVHQLIRCTYRDVF